MQVMNLPSLCPRANERFPPSPGGRYGKVYNKPDAVVIDLEGCFDQNGLDQNGLIERYRRSLWHIESMRSLLESDLRIITSARAIACCCIAGSLASPATVTLTMRIAASCHLGNGHANRSIRILEQGYRRGVAV